MQDAFVLKRKEDGVFYKYPGRKVVRVFGYAMAKFNQKRLSKVGIDCEIVPLEEAKKCKVI